MAESTQGSSFNLTRVDFDSVYQGGAVSPDIDLSFATLPWDIGAPQPIVVELADAGAFTGEVLDVGCGLGEHSIFLANRGHRVTGVDGSAEALREARERAKVKGASVEFVQSDATTLAELEDGRFGSVLDSALYHCLGEEEQSQYAAALHRVSQSAARLRLICFADEAGPGFRLPQPISQENLRAKLGPYWDITSIELGRYVTALTPELVTQEGVERFSSLGFSVDPDQMEVDGQGRILGTVWRLSAVRR